MLIQEVFEVVLDLGLVLLGLTLLLVELDLVLRLILLMIVLYVIGGSSKVLCSLDVTGALAAGLDHLILILHDLGVLLVLAVVHEFIRLALKLFASFLLLLEELLLLSVAAVLVVLLGISFLVGSWLLIVVFLVFTILIVMTLVTTSVTAVSTLRVLVTATTASTATPVALGGFIFAFLD